VSHCDDPFCTLPHVGDPLRRLTLDEQATYPGAVAVWSAVAGNGQDVTIFLTEEDLARLVHEVCTAQGDVEPIEREVLGDVRAFLRLRSLDYPAEPWPGSLLERLTVSERPSRFVGVCQPVTFYRAVCSRCGKTDTGGEYDAWGDPESAITVALDGDWKGLDKNGEETHGTTVGIVTLLCGDCWTWAEDDEHIVAKPLEQRAACAKPVGSKPWWMGVDQYDQCYCVLPPGHDGDCACSHTVWATS
jgi:hypothetical protein